MSAARAITAEPFVVPPLLDFALNFVREETRESCTRLCATCCCVTGCWCAIATMVFAFVNPSQGLTVGALGALISALIGGGMVALLGRKRKPDPDGSDVEETEAPAVARPALVAGGAQ